MKTDFKKSLEPYKAKQGRFDIIDVPAMQYLMIDGHGGPAAASFGAAIETLYPVAYKLKFMSKLDLQQDYVVPPLEALWWADDMDYFTSKFDQSKWDWCAMIMVPSWITQAMFSSALDEVAKPKGKKQPPTMLAALQLKELAEGRCVQTLHLGAYSQEGPVLEQMHKVFIPQGAMQMRGKHHEIYFNDFRKVAPDKLRTILRQPVVSR